MTPFYKFWYRLHRFSSGLGHWVVRRFTPAGLLVLVTLIMAGLFGPDTENNVAYQGFVLLLSLLLVSIAVSGSFGIRFSATRILPQFGTVGTPLRYSISLRNIHPRAQSGLIVMERLEDPRPSFKEWLSWRRAHEKQFRAFRLHSRGPGSDPFKPALLSASPLPAVAARQEVEVPAELTPMRRGMLRFAGMTVARPDPLGLFRALANLSLPQSVLILPKRYPVPPIALPGTMKYQEGGVALSSSVGQSDEFVALRDYRHGDPVRHIHWRSWAKVGKPVVKEFEDEFFVRHALVLDTFTEHPRSDAFEEAVSVAASFACTLGTQESLLDLLFVGPHSYCFTSGRGLAHVDQLLEVLAAVQPCADQPFRTLEHLVLNHVSAVSGCICVLLAWDAQRQDFIKKLRALGMPVMVLVIAEAGAASALEPGALTAASEAFHVLEAGNIEQGLARLG